MKHTTLERVHDDGSSTWTCSCSPDVGDHEPGQLLPRTVRARAAAHAGRAYVPEPWEDYGDARDLAMIERAHARADARADNPEPTYARP